MTALIFDCDGVLAETERELHLPEFNQAFEERGLPLQSTVAVYAERLQIAAVARSCFHPRRSVTDPPHQPTGEAPLTGLHPSAGAISRPMVASIAAL